MKSIFPEIITKLPEAGLGIDGLQIFISHSETHEVWFLESDVMIDYPLHSHVAQWSTVINGKIEVTMNGETCVFQKGDQYYLPEGVEHSVKMHAGYSEIIFLNTPNFLGK